jgi:predicted lipoprotein with Yx(FWY)xxD motif
MSTIVRRLRMPILLLIVMLQLAACGSSLSGTSAVGPATAAFSPLPTGEPAITAVAATRSPGATPVSTAPFPTVPQTLVVQWEKNARLGDILTDPLGRTVYTYKNDKSGDSACTGDCAKTWSPLTIAKGWRPWAGPGVPGTVGVIARSDGTYQVTYAGAPLYFYAGDSKPGDANGQGLDGLWNVVAVTPASMAEPTP